MYSAASAGGWRINAARDGWELVPDFRRAVVFDKATGLQVEPPPFGVELPDGMTVEPRPSLEPNTMAQWRDGEWHVLPDFSAAMVYAKETGARVPGPPPGEPLPKEFTLKAPPGAEPDEAAQWSVELDDWSLVPDLRGR